MITLTAKSETHDQSGQYVARLVGRHPKYTFERLFVGRKTGRRDESTEADVDEPGLYEIADIDRRGRKVPRYAVVVLDGTSLREVEVAKGDAMTVARGLDADIPLGSIVRLGDAGEIQVFGPVAAKREQRKADIAVTVDQAAAACWDVLQALPTREAKRVVADLRKRLTPATDSTAAPERESA